MRPLRFALLVAVAALAVACEQGGEIDFPHHATPVAAQADAASRGVPILIDFHADW